MRTKGKAELSPSTLSNPSGIAVRNQVERADTVNRCDCGQWVDVGQALEHVRHALAPCFRAEGVLARCGGGLHVTQLLGHRLATSLSRELRRLVSPEVRPCLTILTTESGTSSLYNRTPIWKNRWVAWTSSSNGRKFFVDMADGLAAPLLLADGRSRLN